MHKKTQPLNQKSTKTSRRSVLKSLASLAACGFTPSAFAQMNEAQKAMLTSLPVSSWLTLGQSTPRDVQAHAQQIISSAAGIFFDTDTSSVTNGPSMTLNRAAGDLLQGESGLNIISIHFNPAQKLELAMFVFNRGWKDKNLDSIKSKLDSKYQQYEKGIWIQDPESEALDKYYVFDIGRFVVEFAVPQFGTFATVSVTTKDTHKKMRIADSTYDIFKDIFEDKKKS